VDADAGALASTRQVYFDGHGHVECPVVSRYRLEPGVEIPGPVIVEEREATTVALPGDSVSLSRHGHLIMSIQAGARR
jgi:N-methylhydantoinase A/oxoprolinase/acetone carboxylase beta subunit